MTQPRQECTKSRVDRSCFPINPERLSMDVLANHSIFQELQLVHDTGYFSAMPSLEENWQQVRGKKKKKKTHTTKTTTSHYKPVRFLHFSADGDDDDDGDDWAHMRSRCRRQLFFSTPQTPPEAWMRVGRKKQKKKKTKKTLFYHSYVTNSRGDGKVEAMGAHAGA